MTRPADFEIFLATAPGLETALRDEVLSRRFKGCKAVPGGAITKGSWPEVWRANLEIRGASRILARIGAFRVSHLKDLDRLSRRVPWGSVLRPDVPFRVEASCRRSRIYHSNAAAERIARAIRDELGAPEIDDAPVTIHARLENDLCTLSVDTSGELLHKRGHKQAVAKAPMRETMAALLLRECGFTGTEPVVDPMCGSGTFVIEAAEIAAGLWPGRSRAFAFEHLATFDAEAWRRLKDRPPQPLAPSLFFYGSDRDPGAIRASRENAERAGVASICEFRELSVDEIAPPDGPSGLVIVNPPYGDRVGDARKLAALYRTLGHTLRTRFKSWRVGLVTTDADLAAATGLSWQPPGPPIAHGGLKVTLFQTGPLG